MLKINAFVIIFVILSNSVIAEDIPVIVIAPSQKAQSKSTVGTSVTIFDEATIAKSNSYFLGDVIGGGSASLNNFQTGGYGSTSGIQLRGLPKRYSTVYIDGVKQYDPGSPSGDYGFEHLLKDQISRVEILKGNQNITSDPFFLGKNFIDKTTNEISRNFGTQFSLQFDDIPVNEWVGPFKSSFGHHIVLVRDSKPGYYPLITEVLNRVEVDLFNANKEAAINNYINQVKSEYKVIINPNLKF